MKYLLTFIGGGMGSMLRYAFSVYLPTSSILPIATLSANIASSFFLGILVTLYDTSSNQRVLLATGFCGGFSTFSTFSAETLSLLQQGNYTGAFTNVLLNLVCCIVAVAAGILISK